MVCHVVRRLREVVAEVVVVAAPDMPLPEELSSLGARVTRDSEEGQGPLAGLAEGLSCVRGELVFVTATDAPFLSPAFVRALLGHDETVAPRVDGHVQTLCACYPAAAHALAGRLLEAGKRRPLDLLEALHFRPLAESELPDLQSLIGFNTPESYLEAARREHPDARASLELPDGSVLELPIGTLAELLGAAAHALPGSPGAPSFERLRCSLPTPDEVGDLGIPIGPGERVLVGLSPAEERAK